MLVESAIYNLLVSDVAIAALVSSRVYPLILPQNATYPALVYSKVSGARLHHLTGSAGRAMPRITVSCWATTYLGAKQLAALVRATLDGFRGTLTDGNSPAGTCAASVLIENELDDYDESAKKYRVILDFMVNHAET